ARFEERSDVVGADPRRIQDFEAVGQFNVLALRGRFNFRWVAEQDASRNSAPAANRSRAHGARLRTFRQNNPLIGFAGSLTELMKKSCRRKPEFEFFS